MHYLIENIRFELIGIFLANVSSSAKSLMTVHRPIQTHGPNSRGDAGSNAVKTGIPRQEQSPPDTGRPDRGSITLGAVEARTAFLVVACTQCSRSGRYRVATLIDQHGAGCVIPELRRVLVNDCPKRGNAHGGCDVWFPELPALFRGDDGGSGGMRPALGLQDVLGSPCD